ncbi:MAG: site-2 protease family protein [Bryobacteraceae bacterium]
MQHDFDGNLPFMGLSEVWNLFLEGPGSIEVWSGLPFSVTLLTILLAHEMGHYLTCRHYGLRSSLPYFLPAPVLIGTFGAFIRIRSVIQSRRTLFDVAFAGPAAGFMFAIPALGIGLALSKVVPGIGAEHQIHFGAPPLLWALERLVFPGIPSEDIYLHPVARAAAIGLLATAWNLLPIGQLDGGHILYAFSGRLHKRLSFAVLGLLLVAGLFFWRGWLVWAFLLLFARRHPSVYDSEPLGLERGRLGWASVAMFLLSFTVTPFEDRSLF